jgi:hypothetical protein
MVDSTKAGAGEEEKKTHNGISFRRFAFPDIGSTTRDLMDGQADSHSACFRFFFLEVSMFWINSRILWGY